VQPRKRNWGWAVLESGDTYSIIRLPVAQIRVEQHFLKIAEPMKLSDEISTSRAVGFWLWIWILALDLDTDRLPMNEQVYLKI
jgi:hypothetical protein